jgi:hypothetical protein
LTHLPARDGPAGRYLFVALVAAVLAASQLASCAAAPNGFQAKSGPAILRAAGSALEAAKTFEIEAISTTSGHQASLTFEIGGPNLGEGSFASSSLSFEAEELNGLDYFRSHTLWAQVGGSSLQSALGYRWVYVSAKSSTAAELTAVFSSLTSPTVLADQLTGKAASAVRGRATTFSGQPVVAVTTPGSGTVYVAITGEPYPLKWLQSSQSQVTFSKFGQDFGITAPKGALNLEAILAG